MMGFPRSEVTANYPLNWPLTLEISSKKKETENLPMHQRGVEPRTACYLMISLDGGAFQTPPVRTPHYSDSHLI
jgi:hypothetical protein